MKRPDYVHHIMHPLDWENCWCGEDVMTPAFHFDSLDHAAVNAVKKGRVRFCPGCVDAAIAALLAHTWRPEKEAKESDDE